MPLQKGFGAAPDKRHPVALAALRKVVFVQALKQACKRFTQLRDVVKKL